MRLLILNPNTTATMTESIGNAARAAAASETTVIARNPDTGPASIQGPEDGKRALPGLFELFDQEVVPRNNYTAVIVACFDDTGLWELKRRGNTPVIGIGEAGYHTAMLLAERFSVVTTLAVSVPVLANNIARYGFATRCAEVRASGVPVLDLETNKGAARRQIAEETARAFREDKVGAVVLGCAGMAELAAELTAEFGKPVIDGVASAVGLCEMLGRRTRRL